MTVIDKISKKYERLPRVSEKCSKDEARVNFIPVNHLLSNIRLREVDLVDHPNESMCISTKKDMPLWQIYLLSSEHEHSFQNN